MINVFRRWPALCVRCLFKIDLAALERARLEGKQLVHPCGRVLVEGKERR